MKNRMDAKGPDIATVILPASSFAMERWRLADYWELAKPRLTFLVLITTFIGFCMGSSAPFNWGLLVHTMLGTAFVAGSAAILNQFLEREADGQMKRTQDRPLPSGRLQPDDALIFGAILGVCGLFYLVTAVNLLTGFIAAITLGSYLFVYTPLKKISPLCTVIGAIPGAMPPMIGWSAARDNLDAYGWILFAILFLWQMPHFYALAQIYREDYARGGFPMLSVVDPTGWRVGMQIVSHTFLLIPASLAPTLFGMTGKIYFWGALILGIGFFYFGLCAAISQKASNLKKLFVVSIFYLPFLLILMLFDKI